MRRVLAQREFASHGWKSVHILQCSEIATTLEVVGAAEPNQRSLWTTSLRLLSLMFRVHGGRSLWSCHSSHPRLD